MTLTTVIAAWVIGSFLFGLLAGQLFRFFGSRGRAEEEFLSHLEQKDSSAVHAASDDPNGEAGLRVA
jgi:hypothetical protein